MRQVSHWPLVSMRSLGAVPLVTNISQRAAVWHQMRVVMSEQLRPATSASHLTFSGTQVPIRHSWYVWEMYVEHERKACSLLSHSQT